MFLRFFFFISWFFFIGNIDIDSRVFFKFLFYFLPKNLNFL